MVLSQPVTFDGKKSHESGQQHLVVIEV